MSLRSQPITGSKIIIAVTNPGSQGNLLNDANALLNTIRPFNLTQFQEPAKGKVFQTEDTKLKARLYSYSQDPNQLVFFLSSDNVKAISRTGAQPVDLKDLKDMFAVLIDDSSNQIITTGQLNFYKLHGLNTYLDFSGDHSKPLRIELSDKDPLAPTAIYVS